MKNRLTRFFNKRREITSLDTRHKEIKNRQVQFKKTLEQLSKRVGDRRVDRLLKNSFSKKKIYLVLESPHASLKELSGHSVTQLKPMESSDTDFSLSRTMLPTWYLDGSTLLIGMSFKDEVFANEYSYEDCILPLVKVLKTRGNGRRFDGAIIYLHQDDLSSDIPPAWLNKMASVISVAALKANESIPVYVVLEGGEVSTRITNNNDSPSIASTPVGMLRDENITTEQFSQWFSQVRTEVSKRLLRKSLKEVQYIHNLESRRAAFLELNIAEENLQQIRHTSEQLNQRWNFSDKSCAPWVRGVFVTPHVGKRPNSEGAGLWWQRFANLLVKDRHCKEAKKSSGNYKQWSVAVGITLAGLAGLFLSQLIWRDYAYASELSNEFTEQLISLHSNTGQTKESEFKTVLNEFNTIEGISQNLTVQSPSASFLTRTVVDRGGVVLGELSEQVLHEQFGAQLNQALLHVLKHHQDFETLYPALKSYLLFHQAREKRDERDEYLMWWFGRQWKNQYKNEPESRQKLAQYLSSFLKKKSNSEQHKNPYEYDEEIVSIARANMLSTPLATRLYLGIKQDANSKQNIAGELKEMIGYSQAEVFGETQAIVSSFYTATGYKTIFLPHLQRALAQSSMDEWVLGLEKAGSEKGTGTSGSLKQAIYQQYIAEYIYAWDEFINHLFIVKSTSFEHLGRFLKASSGNEGAVRRVLQYTYNNTASFSILSDHDVNSALNGLVKSAPIKEAVRSLSTKNNPSVHPMKNVSMHFLRLNSVLKNSENKSSAMDEVDAQIQQLDEYLSDFQQASDDSFNNSAASSAVFDATVKRVIGGKNDPISSLKRTSKMMPEPLRLWVSALAAQAWSHMVYGTKQHVTRAYKRELYATYSTNIKSRYPLHRKSAADVELDHFSDYFKPEGEEQRFFNQYLKPFVRKGNTRWSERKKDGLKLGLTRSYLSQLHRAQIIRDAMFRNQEVFAELQFQPTYLDANVSRFDLELMGERLNYRHGPQKISKIKWPAQLNKTDISMRFEDYNGNLATEDIHGEWSLFKLIDQYGKESMPDGRRYRMSFEVNGQRAVYEVSGRRLTPELLSILNQYRMPLKPLS